MLSLQRTGCNEGSSVKDSSGKIFKVIAVGEGGTVTLREMQPDGNPGPDVSVEYADFVEKYTLTTATFEVCHDWAERVPSKQPAYKESVAKAQVLVALSLMSAEASDALRLQLKPTKSVFVERSFGQQKLCVMPDTTRIVVCDGGQPPKAGLSCTVVSGGEKVMCYLMSMSPFDPAFAIRVTSEPSEANVAISTKIVTITSSLRAKQSSVQVHLPFLSNPERLQKGDELFLFREAEEKGVKRAPPLNFEEGRPSGRPKAAKASQE